MKSIVIYGSKFGNTEKIARAPASGIEALESVDIKGYCFSNLANNLPFLCNNLRFTTRKREFNNTDSRRFSLHDFNPSRIVANWNLSGFLGNEA